MIDLHYLLAVMLLLSPVEPEPTVIWQPPRPVRGMVPAEWMPTTTKHPYMNELTTLYIQGIAYNYEILDGRELRYILVRQDIADLNLLRKRYKEFFSIPRIATLDLYYGLSRDTLNEYTGFNRQYLQYLNPQRAIDLANAEWYQQAIEENDALYYIWDKLRDAHCEYYYITVRRQALMNLINKIGAEDFYQKNLPPPVPIWRFRKMD